MVSLLRRVALGVVCLVAAPALLAQTPTPSFQLPTLPAGIRNPAPDAVALEGAIDEGRYLVGPGDVFTVVIGGLVPRQISATVSADGRLVIPEAGAFDADGRTLRAVRGAVLGGLRRQFRNVTLDVALARPRQFYVHVSGVVAQPGRHLVRPVARVEDAVSEASPAVETPLGIRPGGARALAQYSLPAVGPAATRTAPAAQAATLGADRRPALRNVLVGEGGAQRRVDLMRYFATGDTRYNPYLRDGDVVYVPSFDVRTEGVYVDGAVDRPGVYDVRPDDSAYDLVIVASGLTPSAERVRVSRAGAPSEEVSLDEARRIRVQAGDQVYAVERQRDAAAASVRGAVRYPGTYGVTAGATTLSELVRDAGGLLPTALARAAYVVRAPEADAGLTAADSAGVALLTGLDAFGRAYYTQEFYRPSRISVDLAAALEGRIRVPLRDGDLVVIPEDEGSVRVFGQVARPGLVPFEAGLSVSEYLARAGGLGPDATDAYLVEAATGRLVAGTDTPVQPGDAVFVDRDPQASGAEFAGLSIQERQLALSTQEAMRADRQLELQQLQAEREDRRLELENERARRDARFQLIQTVITAVSTVATVVIALSSIERSN